MKISVSTQYKERLTLETCTGKNSSTLMLPYPSDRIGVLYPKPATISNGLTSLAQISANASITKRFVSAETLEVVGPLNIVLML